MKTLMIFLYLFPAFFSSFANDAYTKAMKKNIEALETASSLEDYVELSNSFERIASLKADEWLPPYYCAYTNVMISHRMQDTASKDKYLDKAQAHIDKAMSLKKDDSEITALQGYILMMKVAVDPASRGQVLAGKVLATFEKAVKLNPDNPRAQFLLGNWAYGTAQFFKSDTSEPCRMIKNSIDLFENEQTEDLYPNWGQKMAIGMLQYCN